MISHRFRRRLFNISSPHSKYNSTVADSFEIIARQSFSEKRFTQKPIEDYLIHKIIELTQLAPSSFNLQPYKLLIVRSTDAKAALSESMLGNNVEKVFSAPVSVVFMADKDPSRLTRRLMTLESENGSDPSYISSLPAKMSFLHGSGKLANKVRAVGSHLMSPLVPMPTVYSSESVWSIKNTIFAAQQLMLAATSLGIGSTPMEGFDELRLCYAMGIPPQEYSVPLVVSLGYPEIEEEEEQSGSSGKVRTKLRHKMEDMCYSDKFGIKLDCHNISKLSSCGVQNYSSRVESDIQCTSRPDAPS